eukprot:scaffold29141_cov144-Isochrysis_galbana.AAC.2
MLAASMQGGEGGPCALLSPWREGARRSVVSTRDCSADGNDSPHIGIGRHRPEAAQDASKHEHLLELVRVLGQRGHVHSGRRVQLEQGDRQRLGGGGEGAQKGAGQWQKWHGPVAEKSDAPTSHEPCPAPPPLRPPPRPPKHSSDRAKSGRAPDIWEGGGSIFTHQGL